MFQKNNPIVNFDYFIYDKTGRIKRDYFVQAIDYEHPEKGFELVNYTEYEYDKLGRKIKVTTRVKPDPKYQKKELMSH